MLDLNNPDTRHRLLRERLVSGSPLVAASLAEEFGVSGDTIRRDLIALEEAGVVERVRGGAVPVAPRMASYAQRVRHDDPDIPPLAELAASLISPDATVLLDGGRTLRAVAERLPDGFTGLVVTPAPAVALAANARGARVELIGGTLCGDGAIATGGGAERAVSTIAADLCVLGACGLWAEAGLGAEDAGEAGVKRAMAAAAGSVLVVGSREKFACRSRHVVLRPSAIDTLVTDADEGSIRPYRNAGVCVRRPGRGRLPS